MNTTPTAVQRFIDATNAGDTEAFLDAFTSDASLNDWGREFTGRDGIASWNRTAEPPYGSGSSSRAHAIAMSRRSTSRSMSSSFLTYTQPAPSV